MRIRQIDLRCFGRFTDRVITLPDDLGVHVLHGPNEAGKTTLLDAITYTLHGMPAGASKEPKYDFEHATTKLRTGLELVDDDGRVVNVLRRRGNKGTVLDPASDTASEPLAAQLDRLLRGVPKDVWINKHGLSRQRLRAGAKAMLDGKGSAEDALVAASGVVIVRQVLREIRDRREALLKSTGRSGLISDAAAEFGDATKAIKQATAAARRVEADIAERGRRRSERERTAASVRAVEAELAQLDALVAALGVLLEREQLEARVAAIEPPTFPWERADSDELAAVTQELDQHLALVRRLQARREELAAKLDSLTVDPRLGDAHEQSMALSQRVEKVRDARGQLPLLEAGVHSGQEQLARALAAVDAAADATADATSLLAAVDALPTSAQRADVAARADEGRTLLSKLEEETVRLRQADRALAEAEQAVRELGDGTLVDPARLSALLETAAGINLAKWRELRESIGARRHALELQARALPGCDLDVDGVRALALPAQAGEAAIVRRIEELDRELARASEELDNARAKRERHEAELQELLRERDVPDPAELRRLRAARDEAWQVIRDGVEGRSTEQLDEAAGSIPAFEQSLEGADRFADGLTAHGELLGQVTQLRRKLEEEDERIPRYAAQLDSLTAQRAELLAGEWTALWASAGIEAGSPEAMAELRSRIDDVRACAVSLETDETYVRTDATQIDDVGRELSAALGEPIAADAPPVDATRLEALVHDARARRDAATKGEQERAGAVAAASVARRTAQQAARDRDELQARLDAWQAGWRTHVAALGLPADATPDMARARIGELAEVDAHAGELRRTLQARKQATLLVEEFDGAVATLVAQLGDAAPDTADLAPEAALARVCRSIDEARATAGQQGDCRAQLEQLDADLADARAGLQDVERRSARLDERVGGIDRDELLRVDGRWRERADLLAQVEAIDTQLMHDTRMRVADLVELRAGDDAPRLAERRAELEMRRLHQQEQLDAVDAELNELSERIGAVMSSDELARAQQQRADALARLELLVPEYRQLALQEHLLERFLADASKDDLGPLLTLAGDYFARLTCGRYLRLATEVDDGGQVRVLGVRPERGDGDGVESVTVEGMSEGTRDQLFLALRLAKLVLDAQAGGERMPLVVDDILLTFDDERSAATMELLGDVSQHIQVIFLTHHQHLVDLAAQTIPAERLGAISLVEATPAAG